MVERDGLERVQAVGECSHLGTERRVKIGETIRRKPLMTVRLPGKGSKKDARA